MNISDMPKEKLKKTPYFHLIDPARLDGFNDFTAWLEAMLHNPCSVWEEGEETFLIEIKQLVARVNGLKIEIYPNEHPPPHFHVKSPNVDAVFDIENCSLIKGNLTNQDKKKIIYWHMHAKSILVEAWNSTRPTNCVVGKYSRG